MHTVYILRSLRDDSLYVGTTERTAEERLREHNAAKTEGIRNRLPYTIVRVEHYEHFEIALARERFFKTGKGRKVLKSLLSDESIAGKTER